MPPKGSKRKAEVVEAPPLPDEQPPLPDEAPPLPMEQPPLPDEQPPLPDEQPPLPEEQPPLPNEQPPLPNEAPPLPNEQPPLPTEPAPQASSSSSQSGSEDPKSKQPAKDKGKGKGKADAHPWQAVWSPERSAWYFWNTETQEVTWTNPLAPKSESSGSQPPLPNEPAPSSSKLPLPPRPKLVNGLPEIDPALAHLVPPEQRDATTAALSAAFTARTGRAATDAGYGFAHLDEYNRVKRFSEHYFDVEGWEKQRAMEGLKRQAEEAAGIVRETKITKKDMVSLLVWVWLTEGSV